MDDTLKYSNTQPDHITMMINPDFVQITPTIPNTIKETDGSQVGSIQAKDNTDLSYLSIDDKQGPISIQVPLSLVESSKENLEKVKNLLSEFPVATVSKLLESDPGLVDKLLSGVTDIGSIQERLKQIQLDIDVEKFAAIFPGFADSTIRSFAKNFVEAFKGIVTGGVNDKIVTQKELYQIELQEYQEQASLEQWKENLAANATTLQYKSSTKDTLQLLQTLPGFENVPEKTLLLFLAQHPEYQRLNTGSNENALSSSDLIIMSYQLTMLQIQEKIAESLAPSPEEIKERNKLEEKKKSAKEQLEKSLEKRKDLSEDSKKSLIRSFENQIKNLTNEEQISTVLSNFIRNRVGISLE